MKTTEIMGMPDYSSSFNKVMYSHIPKGATCLDVGCSTGNLGAALVRFKNCTVDGIEYDRRAAGVATGRGYRAVHVLNLNEECDSVEKLDSNYDVIVCGDVLEHLVQPEKVLRSLLERLKPDGRIIASLPNVAFILVRLNLLFGRWDYREFGTLDKTHLRFFTIDSGARLFRDSGLDVLSIIPYNQFGLLRYIEPLKVILPRMFAYQFLVIASLRK
jgi:2-polyprenyl-3-methyl-5-hydroxy-6-metoxy-1,4-benzoquinol methylase